MNIARGCEPLAAGSDLLTLAAFKQVHGQSELTFPLLNAALKTFRQKEWNKQSASQWQASFTHPPAFELSSRLRATFPRAGVDVGSREAHLPLQLRFLPEKQYH